VAIVRKFLIDIGMQLPEKYKENFEVWSEGPSSLIAKRAQKLAKCGKPGQF
jgi:hypothetical protein